MRKQLMDDLSWNKFEYDAATDPKLRAESGLVFGDVPKKESILDAFKKKNKQIAQELGIHEDWLMAIYNMETGQPLDTEESLMMAARSQNKANKATGIINFTQKTAKESLGTSVDKIRSMSPVQQLDYVKKYLTPYAGKMKNFHDLYLAALFPAAIGKDDNYVLQTKKMSANYIRNQNPGLDTNKDNVITVGDVKTVLDARYPQFRKKQLPMQAIPIAPADKTNVAYPQRSFKVQQVTLPKMEEILPKSSSTLPVPASMGTMTRNPQQFSMEALLELHQDPSLAGSPEFVARLFENG